MKNYKLLFSVAVAAAMFGCSSMEVDDDEAYSENLPTDFSYAEYMAIHPTLRYLQIKDVVTARNDAFKESSGEGFNDAKAADEAAFEANVENLHGLYVDPFVGGYTEEEWAIDMSAGTKDSLIYNTVDHYLNITVVDNALPVKLVIGEWDNTTKTYTGFGVVEKDSSGAIVKVSGNNAEGTLVEYEIAGDISINNQGTKIRKDTVSVDTIPVATEGGVPADKMKNLKNFNLYDTENDLIEIQAIPVDTFAISYHFVLFGKLHGWAYRPCTESEKAKDAVLPEYPAEKLYCDDNGKTKEID